MATLKNIKKKKEEMKIRSVNLKLNEDLYLDFKKVADANNHYLSDVLREGIRVYLKEWGK